MRRVQLVLSAAALLAAFTAAGWLVTVPAYGTVATSSSVAYDGTVAGPPPAVPTAGRTLVDVNGRGTYVLLAGLILLAGVPLAMDLARSPAGHLATWTVAGLMTVVSILAGFSIGLFFLPAAGLLLAAAVASSFRRPRPGTP